MNGARQRRAFPGDRAAHGHDAWLAVVGALRRVFPFVDIEEINRFEPLADEVDMTAAERADLMAAVTDLTGVVVPESDYPSVDTVDALERYVAARLDARMS